MPTDLEQLARLALAAVLGGLVGAERELADQPAGLRTHVLLAVGTCLFTLVSAYGFGQGADPSRLAAQIVTGTAFAVERVVELLHGEGVSLRGLEREVGTDGGRVLLVTRMPPRYQTEHLIEELAKLDGVREVEWEG